MLLDNDKYEIIFKKKPLHNVGSKMTYLQLKAWNHARVFYEGFELRNTRTMIEGWKWQKKVSTT